MTILSTAAPELDIPGTLAAYESRVREACPEHLPLAMRVLERLPPARWPIEWYLPWWLADTFELDREIAREIVLSNLLGLASIRLQDDLADGEVAAADVAAAIALSGALYEAALRPYRARFEPDSPFWHHLEATMQEWREAAHVAGRGAPLKISAFAVCLLAGRADTYPELAACLDHALDALVLYDHVADWEIDLDAGRWNAFIASIASDPQIPAFRDRNRSAVLVSLLTTDAVTAYFARIEDEMQRAAALADAPGVSVRSLADHLRGFAATVNRKGMEVEQHYRTIGERAARLLLETPIEAGPSGRP